MNNMSSDVRRTLLIALARLGEEDAARQAVVEAQDWLDAQHGAQDADSRRVVCPMPENVRQAIDAALDARLHLARAMCNEQDRDMWRLAGKIVSGAKNAIEWLRTQPAASDDEWRYWEPVDELHDVWCDECARRLYYRDDEDGAEILLATRDTQIDDHFAITGPCNVVTFYLPKDLRICRSVKKTE